jgi:hypothetical protein
VDRQPDIPGYIASVPDSLAGPRWIAGADEENWAGPGFTARNEESAR